MISICWLEDSSHRVGFICEGHAGYREPGETDEVCAAITALAGSLVTAWTDILNLDVTYQFESGLLYGRVEKTEDISQETWDKADLLLESFILGCKQIELSYGSQYISVTEPRRIA